MAQGALSHQNTTGSLPTCVLHLQCPEVSCTFLVLEKALAMLDLEQTWTLEFWKLVSTEAAVLDLKPDMVAVQPWGEQRHFWPLQRAARGGPKRQRTGWASVAAGVKGPAMTEEEPEAGDAPADEGSVSGDDSVSGRDDDSESIGDRVLAELFEEEGKATPPVLDAGREETEAEGHADAVATDEPELEGQEAVEVTALAAGGEVAAAPAAAAEAAPVAPKAALPRTRAPPMTTLDLGELGKISYHNSKEAFECVCSQPGHIGCTLSRTSKGRRSANQVVAGRPLGFLACWMLFGGECASKEEHRDKKTWGDRFTLAERQVAREWLVAQPGSEALFAFERPQEEGEETEPPTLLGLL